MTVLYSIIIQRYDEVQVRLMKIFYQFVKPLKFFSKSYFVKVNHVKVLL